MKERHVLIKTGEEFQLSFDRPGVLKTALNFESKRQRNRKTLCVVVKFVTYSYQLVTQCNSSLKTFVASAKPVCWPGPLE